MAKDIDFFFFIGTTYIYLTVMRIDRVVADVGVQVRWRPFNVRQKNDRTTQYSFPWKAREDEIHVARRATACRAL